MYTYYEKNGYRIMEYDFSSITEFLNYINSQPVNREAFSGDLSSETGSYSFTQTHSLEEALELFKYGWHEDFEKLIELKCSLEKYIKMSKQRQKQFNDYIGYAPDVKAYLEGNPLSMLNKEQPKRKHVDIYFSAAYSAYTTTSQIFNRGAVTLSLVEILEKMGFSVGLYVFTLSKSYDQLLLAKFNLKAPGERLNVQKLYFPMCHPSFLRRLEFRLDEVTPDIEKHWNDGYGYPCGDHIVREILNLKDNDIVISRPDEMGVKGDSIVDDANSIFDYINKFKGKDFILDKIETEEIHTMRR